MQIYQNGSEPLHEILKAASSNEGATLLVPDLQRPYVWTPSQVTLLVDSLLRGWPFGTLLLWRVRNEELEGIPSRPFWRIMDRTSESNNQQIGKSNPPAQFRMVLDGQQRLQSLLLAFGGDAWGFRLPDYEWSAMLGAERPKGRNAKRHWSLGHLCLDLWAFRQQLQNVEELENIDFRDVLLWVVQSHHEGHSVFPRSINYKYPIENALDAKNEGRFIRLSRLWDLAPTGQKPAEKFFRENLRPILTNHNVPEDVIKDVLEPLAQLMIKIVDTKQANVSFLQLSPFDAGAGGSQDVYNDAIVNIFTRLNTAGRALSRQEITFAWIKNGWGDGSKTDNRTAGRCFEDLNESLKEAGVVIDIDGLVGMVSAMWSVTHRNGTLLTEKDLLRGEKVRPMAQDLVDNWESIVANAISGSQLVKDRQIEFGKHYRSVNVLTLLLTWRLLGQQWLAARRLNVTATDGFTKSLDEIFNDKCDRWILMSLWSGRWGKSTDKAFAEYAKSLAEDWAQIKKLNSQNEVLEILESRMKNWIQDLKNDSIKYIDELSVLTRDRVQEYYLPLWFWHRLNSQRWAISEIQLRQSKRGNLSLDVDHIVAVKLWEKLVNSQKQNYSEDEKTESSDDFEQIVNALGNCCLLNKSFNIAKGARPFSDFLKDIHELKNGTYTLEKWGESLDIDKVLIDPTDDSTENVSAAIEKRTALMKDEIKEYLNGARQRVDL